MGFTYTTVVTTTTVSKTIRLAHIFLILNSKLYFSQTGLPPYAKISSLPYHLRGIELRVFLLLDFQDISALLFKSQRKGTVFMPFSRTLVRKGLGQYLNSACPFLPFAQPTCLMFYKFTSEQQLLPLGRCVRK